ncbi:MAG TPA: radical SAM protein [Acidobacteriaceae bacterium]
MLVKPRNATAHFGLAPFFRTEPLGLEYISAALKAKGHVVQVVDMNFERRSIALLVKTQRPQVVGISCVHILDVAATLQLALELKEFDPAIFVAVGGHAIGSYPDALLQARGIDAICTGEGESVMPALGDALARGTPLSDVPGLLLPTENGGFASTGDATEWLDLSGVACPDRSAVSQYRKHYVCLNYMPVWTLETARGCHHHCKFCSVWQFYKGSCRYHAMRNVRIDFEQTGKNLFIIDDLFWSNPDRSGALARELLASRQRKNWMLVQSRVDLVSANPDLLRMWRPLAKNFDIFFGFESPTRKGLDALHKGTDISKTLDAVRTARECGFGVTGNFIIDPDFSEDNFLELWEFIEAHQLYRVGFTLLTPLPGTQYFKSSKAQLKVDDWSQFDLHHLLWKPRLPVERFFELYCETWRRTVLNPAGRKKWWKWLRHVDLLHIGHLARILARSQQLMNPQAYLAEYKVPADSK